MPMELELLIASTILGILQMLSTGMATTRQCGLKYSLSSRDEQKPVEGKPGRVIRAYHNFVQGFLFFAVAILIAQTLNIHNAMNYWGAQLFFWARLIYIPCYVFDLTPWRSVVWFISLAGIAMALLALV